MLSDNQDLTSVRPSIPTCALQAAGRPQGERWMISAPFGFPFVVRSACQRTSLVRHLSGRYRTM